MGRGSRGGIGRALCPWLRIWMLKGAERLLEVGVLPVLPSDAQIAPQEVKRLASSSRRDLDTATSLRRRDAKGTRRGTVWQLTHAHGHKLAVPRITTNESFLPLFPTDFPSHLIRPRLHT